MTRITLAYAGRRLTTKDALAYAYVHEDDPDKTRLYSKPLWPGLRIGVEIEVEEREESIILNGLTVLSQTANDAAITEWSVADKIAQVQHAKIVDNKRRAKLGTDPIQDALDVISQAYGAIPRNMASVGRRAAFLDYVTSYIQGVR